MARRREAEGLAAAEPPGWVVAFRAADWADADDVPPVEWGFGSQMFGRIRADQRWEAAGRKWMAEHGRDPRDWFRATRPRRTDGTT